MKTAVDNSQQSGLQTSPYRSVDAQEETRWKKITITTGPTEEDLIMSVRHNVTSVQHAFNSGYDAMNHRAGSDIRACDTLRSCNSRSQQFDVDHNETSNTTEQWCDSGSRWCRGCRGVVGMTEH